MTPTPLAARALPLALVLALAAHAGAEPAAVPVPDAPPVRYDADHLPASFHAGRRAAVLSTLPEGSAAVVFGAPVRTRSNDVNYEFRQANDLYYLTGTHEPGSALLLAPGGVEVDGRRTTEVLFVPDRDPSREVWTGRRFGTERAQSDLGLAVALPLSRFEAVAGPVLAAHDVFTLPLADGVPAGSDLDRQLGVLRANARLMEVGGFGARLAALLTQPADGAQLAQAQTMARGLMANERMAPVVAEAREDATFGALLDAFLRAETFDAWAADRDRLLDGVANTTALRATLDDLRAVKTPDEMALLQRAIDITVEAHREAMRSIEPGMAEYEAEALIEYVFKRNGAEEPGFPSIVGSGENTPVLHYETNRRTMAAGDLVVMDVGAEVRGYSADVTRTVPVDGTFSPEQRAIYELVLRAQEAGIEATRAGRSFQDPGRAATEVIANGLMELGLIAEPAGVRRFFYHGTSHYLGLDVHDVGTGGPLRPGEVITVEPGVYIAPAEDVDPKWWNVGVRIEDDVLVTDGDPVVLSAGAPREVEAIEALMRERGLGNEPAGRVGG